MRNVFTLVTGLFVTGLAALALSCTDALAPANDGKLGGLADRNGADKIVGPDAVVEGSNGGNGTGGNTGGTGGNTGGTGGSTGGTDSGATTGGEAEEKKPKGNVLGAISGEKGDLGLKAKSVYALYNETEAGGMTIKSLSFTISSYEYRDSMFKKVKKYECEKCDGDDDERCKQDTNPVDMVSVSFSPSFTGAADHKVGDDSYPKQDANEVVEGGFSAPENLTAGMTIFWSKDAAAQGNFGKFDFAAGKRPAKVGDEFKVKAKLTSGGKTYEADLTGKVYQLPQSPTPPQCDSDEYLDVEYED